MNYQELKKHLGHEIELNSYGTPKQLKYKIPQNISIECMTCNVVLADVEADND